MPDDVSFTDIYVDDAIVDRVSDVLDSQRYVKGPALETFEQRFADACGTDHAVGLSSGTAALLLSLQAAGIGDDDDVFVPGHTFYASVSPILELDANPVFVDIDPSTYTIDTDSLTEAIEAADAPEAVVPVHLYGQMAAMDDISALAAEYDVTVVEDACQAHFAERDGETAGTVGDAGAFSFYPSKNMTVAGDGGMLVTDRDDIAERACQLRNHGRDETGTHQTLGLNYRMDETNAAVGIEQLKQVQDWNHQRNAAAQQYTDRLSDIEPVITPTAADDGLHVYHLYVIQVPAVDRDDLRTFLDDHGIETGIHYETPAHQHPSVADRITDVSLPETERLCDRIISLPMHPRLTDADIDHVCTTIERFFE